MQVRGVRLAAYEGGAVLPSSVLTFVRVRLILAGPRYCVAEYQTRPTDNYAYSSNRKITTEKARSYHLCASQNPHTKGAESNVGNHRLLE